MSKVLTGASGDRERKSSTKSGVWPDDARQFAGVLRRWSTLRGIEVNFRFELVSELGFLLPPSHLIL